MAKRMIVRLLKLERQLHYDEREAMKLVTAIQNIRTLYGDDSARRAAVVDAERHHHSLQITRKQLVQLKQSWVAGEVPK